MKKIVILFIILSLALSVNLYAQNYSSLNYTLKHAKLTASASSSSSINFTLKDVFLGNLTGGKASSLNYSLDTHPSASKKKHKPDPPTIDEVVTPTNITTQIITGTKQANTAIYLNGFQKTPLTVETTYSFTVDLLEGGNDLFATAKNSSNVESNSTYINILLDTVAPTDFNVIDQGDYTTTNTQLYVSWTRSTGTGSGLREYTYALGTAEGEADIVDHTSRGLTRAVTIRNLNLEHGVIYYVTVRAYDNAGNYTECYSDGIQYNNPPTILTFTTSLGAIPSFHQNSSVSLNTDATDPDGDQIEYRYTFDNHLASGTIRDFNVEPSTTWNPAANCERETILTVVARSSGIESSPDQKQVYIFINPIEPQ